MTFNAPHIDYAGLSPVIALTAGMCVVLVAGLFLRSRWTNAGLTIAVLGATAGLSIWQWGSNTDLVAGALRLDAFGRGAAPRRLDAFGRAPARIAGTPAAIAVLLSIREPAAEEAHHGAFYTLLLG